MSFIIGQEFLDAFPVHQFIYTKKGWREKLIDIDREIYAEEVAEYEGNEAKPYPYHFRMIISKSITPAVSTFITAENEKVKQFRESLKGSSSIAPETQLEEGDGLEISPLTLTHCEDIATRVMKTGGASLLIDYGEDFAQEDTLRGYKNHEQKAILSEVSISVWNVKMYFYFDFLFLAWYSRYYCRCKLCHVSKSSCHQRSLHSPSNRTRAISHEYGNRRKSETITRQTKCDR